MTSVFVGIMGPDCTNYGVTSGKTNADLVLDGEPTSDQITHAKKSETPLLQLKPRRVGTIPMAVPYGETGYPMFGGHWIYTSDSRFPFEHPIPVHDRFEK